MKTIKRQTQKDQVSQDGNSRIAHYFGVPAGKEEKGRDVSVWQKTQNPQIQEAVKVAKQYKPKSLHIKCIVISTPEK